MGKRRIWQAWYRMKGNRKGFIMKHPEENEVLPEEAPTPREEGPADGEYPNGGE